MIKYRANLPEGIVESASKSDLEDLDGLISIDTIEVTESSVPIYRWPIPGGVTQSYDEADAIAAEVPYETTTETVVTESVLAD
jgi:hypothetical protein